MTRFRLAFVVASLAAVPMLFTSAGASPAPYGFHAPVTMPGSQQNPPDFNGGDEPSLAISAGGARFVSWQSPGDFAFSDDGIHFTHLGKPDPEAVGDVTNAIDAAGAIYNGQICGDMNNVLHSCIYRSTDGGKTWSKTQIADNHPGASDRPWIDVYPHQHAGTWNPDETTVYLEYHTFSPDDLTYVTVSKDGGKTFSLPKVLASDTNAVADSGCNTVPGGVTVDDKTGTAYAVWISGDQVTQNAATGCNYSQIGPFTKAWVSTSTDGGETWTSHLAWHGDYDATTNVGDNADKLFPSIAVDREGRPTVLLAVRHHDDPLGLVAECEQSRATMSTCRDPDAPTDLLLTSSPDQGAHWTAPVKINASTGSYFFPWIAAGSGGTVVAIYYKSTSLSPNDPASIWYAASAQITGVNPAASGDGAVLPVPPAVQETLLDPAPVHKGGICTYGLFCSAVPDANRRLADSIAIALDPAGGANAVWTDDAEWTADAPKRAIRFACQNAGPSAFAGKPELSACYAPVIAAPTAPKPPSVLGQRKTRPGELAQTGVADSPVTGVVLLLAAAGIAAVFRRNPAGRRA
jgi:hypothetical protein